MAEVTEVYIVCAVANVPNGCSKSLQGLAELLRRGRAENGPVEITPPFRRELVLGRRIDKKCKYKGGDFRVGV